ncbi:hypothetical protein BKA70DRAFT_1302188 [Coprinopsis sp. MPI-PUGE-AT-0042]|nr:hypothetical protein BKA70DRAFT_1302188 [Coprinopsis sp. MPI-PUGE-AT-0042]
MGRVGRLLESFSPCKRHLAIWIIFCLLSTGRGAESSSLPKDITIREITLIFFELSSTSNGNAIQTKPRFR